MSLAQIHEEYSPNDSIKFLTDAPGSPPLITAANEPINYVDFGNHILRQVIKASGTPRG